jgi:GTP cyclohydrolase IB
MSPPTFKPTVQFATKLAALEPLEKRIVKTTATGMPDVANDLEAGTVGTLDRVGMQHIEVPVQIVDSQGRTVLTPARADAFVNLIDPKSKGIHMSRLFLSLQEHLEKSTLDFPLLQSVVDSFCQSHEGLSDSASVKVSFDYLVQRPALISDYKGWRSYPVTFSVSSKKGVLRQELSVRVTYSSTCPCSAALARQLIQEKFREDFSHMGAIPFEQIEAWIRKDSSILATPHSQRSFVDVQIAVDASHPSLSFLELIDGVEKILGTPVQAAVKREDEQEFARLNGKNLMFCEDAARRVKALLEKDRRVVDYRVQANHVESLHPHDAVSIVTKGIDGGFRA